MKHPRKFFIPTAAMGFVLFFLVPVFVIMTMERLKRQEELFTQKLLEKGISLIRTFEAGTRAGMFKMLWGAGRIQVLLTETAMQPNVDYMMITTKAGRILSHSNPALVGQHYENMPETSHMADDPVRVYHRVLGPAGQAEVFEVFKRFEPVRSPTGHGPGRRHRMKIMGREHGMHTRADKKKDWSKSYWDTKRGDADRVEHYMIAGLSMKSANKARDRLVKQTVFQGVLYFLLAFAGMAAVFIFQAYRSARASLSSVKAYSDTVIQNMPSGLITTDTLGEVTAMNDAAKQILGPDTSRIQPSLTEVIDDIESGKSIVGRELGIDMATDKSVLLDLTASGIRDSENRNTGFLFLFKDLTQVNELKHQVETNKRLAAIGKLAAGVAHEIRNPLSSIKGFATYFGRRYKDNASDRQTAQIMVKEVERINRSITQLLEFAKPMPTHRSVVDLRSVIDHSLKLVAQDLDARQIEARVDISVENPDVCTDGDRVNQVLLNLYMNALQAMGNKGHLDIKVSRPSADAIEIQVCDDGCGMDEKVQESIFDPYFTTRTTGTGLGLSIVHRIMENLGGGIQVRSSPGKGTCFKLFLPAGVKNEDCK